MTADPAWPVLEGTVVRLTQLLELVPQEGRSFELTASRADYIKDELGVDVYDEGHLYDYLVGYVAAISIAHSVLHGLGLDEHADCQEFQAYMLANCLPLLPLIPRYKVKGEE